MVFQQDAVIIEPKQQPKASIIWLHGLGADGHDFEPIVAELKLTHTDNTRFIFPHAPLRPVTINNGLTSRAWYDIKSPDLTELQDELGIAEAAALIDGYIQAEINAGIPVNNIILAGFSQGGAMAIYTGLTYQRQLGGILVLSSYLPVAEKLATTAVMPINIMMIHGSFDPVIPIAQSKKSYDILKQWGYNIVFKEYPMQHTLCADEVNCIAQWLEARLKLMNNR